MTKGKPDWANRIFMIGFFGIMVSLLIFIFFAGQNASYESSIKKSMCADLDMEYQDMNLCFKHNDFRVTDVCHIIKLGDFENRTFEVWCP